MHSAKSRYEMTKIHFENFLFSNFELSNAEKKLTEVEVLLKSSVNLNTTKVFSHESERP